MIPFFTRIWLWLGVALISLHLSAAMAQEAVPEKPLSTTESTTEPATEATSAAEKPAAEAPAPEAKEKPAKPMKGIEQMTEEEKAAAGLDKLSPAEVEYLNEWMLNYKKMAEKKAAEKATQETKKESAKVEGELAAKAFSKDRSYALVSKIDGEMPALTGRTIIRLEDGTKWKQANRDDRYRPRVTDHPAAAVFYTQFGYKMRIEGMPDFYVDPVRE